MKTLFLCLLMTSILTAAYGPPAFASLRIFNRR